ncbi:AraC family transcriptional regulator [Streptomyces formicae]|uniref:Transcriptional regulator, AraC family n=1 Tax=Streptomyces formicae TaxID=1616117 RepID=A0A291QGM0_9ACTN|nr:AraC family transcriptional regulator [Streptomyces formicae]ATL30624.1 Transcriptional regulator, AraC family [Streptomyces formicae]
MDVLSDAIAAMRTGRPHAGRTEKYAPWGVRFVSPGRAGFHAVLEGSAWLVHADGGAEPVPLGAGDVVFVARSGGHALVSEPGTPVEEIGLLPDGTWPKPPALRRVAGRPPSTVMVCGAYLLDENRPHPLLSELPDVVHLPAGDGDNGALRAALGLLGAELADPQPGTDTIVSSMLDTLLLLVLRTWWLQVRGRAGELTGWAAALADPVVAAALRAIHSDPAHPWTVGELGALSSLSRAPFARRFTASVGTPPLAYLTWWRMTTAAGWLREPDDAPLRSVAERAGYASEFAFAKAFKREFGMAPGRYRKLRAAG